MGETNWSERQEALKSITGFIISYWEVLLEAGKLDGYIDCLLEKLEDGSVKVVHCALACLKRLQGSVPGALGHCSPIQLVIISALHGSASSSNRYSFILIKKKLSSSLYVYI